jgi:hypothetical protein
LWEVHLVVAALSTLQPSRRREGNSTTTGFGILMAMRVQVGGDEE